MSEETQVLPNDGSPPGHIDAMLRRANPAPADDNEVPAEGEQQVTARPDNVPEKFWDAEKGVVNTEALLKAQADAEAALRATQQGDPKPTEGEQEAPAEGEPEVTKEQAPVVANASKEFAEKGELSEETFKSLEGVGLSKEMVNAYIEGQKAIVSNLQSAAYEPFEGKDGYDKAADWAAQNLPDGEIQAIDVQLTSNNPAIVAQGAKALMNVYAENADVEPSLLRGNANNSDTGANYGSRAEMMKDMASSQYRTSEAFRTEVREKLRRSKL